jgi:uncharacterized protein
MLLSSIGQALTGGVLVGLGASLLLLCNGKVAGISGIFDGLLAPKAGDIAWRVAFCLGLLAGGVALLAFYPSALSAPASRPLASIAIAGLLVGYGARLGEGCTSGHGICGLSRSSARSLVATITFMLMGVFTVFISAHVLGGRP